MSNRPETPAPTGFESPLHLWIALWQRQLLYGR